MIGQTLGHYRITGIMGAGGMGEVFRARDTKLGREVALKLLPPDLAAHADRRERFRREARTLAALDHPNIVTVYSVEECGGLHFLTMALIEGETLDRLIPPGGMAMSRLLEIAIPLVDALAAAHERGVVHRDLKPGNVMVRPDGRLTILDFGIAKDLGEGAGTGGGNETLLHTTAGALVGTMPYMSPEQLECLDVDARSDVFSLGVVLYEMATGRRPFQGPSAAALASAILKDEPPPLADARPDAPRELGELIQGCLRKSREARIRTAREVKTALEAIRSPETEPSRPAVSDQSIAVLPFVNLGAGADQEYLSDGITEEILNVLTQIPGLRVAARASSFAFREAASDLRKVGDTLRVRTVLEGSVRRSGNRLRVTAQLVDVETGYHLWSERYDRELTDVFQIQDEIAAAIAARLEVTLAAAGGKRAARRRTSNLQAYDEYLRALALQTRRGGSIHRAIPCLDRAIALDPTYADAHALLADAYRLLATYGFETATVAMPRARAAAEKALGLDPSLAEAHATLADVAGQYDRDGEAAFRSWARALELQPGHTRARCERALWGVFLGRVEDEEAVREARRGVDADPLNVWAMSMLCLILGIAGRPVEGLSLAGRARELDPESYLARFATVQSEVWAGQFEEAVAAGNSALRMSGRHHWVLGVIGVAHAGAGNREKAEAVYDELKARARLEYMQPFWPTYVACALGAVDEAMKWANQAVEDRDPMGVFMTRWTGVHSVLQEHPGFPALLKKLRAGG